MGEITNLRWHWESNNNNTRVGYVSCEGRVSLAEIVEHIRAITPEVNPDDIRVNFATVTWTREATPEEIADRRERMHRHDARHEEWERRTLGRLLRKYGQSGAWYE